VDLTDNHSPALSSLVNIRSVALNFFLWDFTVLAFLLFLIINHFLFPKVPELIFLQFVWELPGAWLTFHSLSNTFPGLLDFMFQTFQKIEKKRK
jgi:hypothetical protein